MFETAVRNGTKEFRFEEKIAKSGRMDADVAALFIAITTTDSQIAFFQFTIRGRSSGSICDTVRRWQVVIRIVDKILFVRHCDVSSESCQIRIYSVSWRIVEGLRRSVEARK